MNIGIQTWGSRGDINPWIALGQGLQKAGHQVTLFYTNYSGTEFTNYSRPGLEIRSTRELLPSSGAYQKVPCKKLYDMNAIEQTLYMMEEIYALFSEEIEMAAEYLCQNNQYIINNPTLYQTSCLAEKYAIPCITILVETQLSPFNTVTDYSDTDINWVYLAKTNGFRLKHGMLPVKNIRTEVICSKVLTLLAFSKIFGGEECQTIEKYRICGFLELENETKEILPPTLQEFLDNGTPPIFFSMGSLSFFEGDNFDILDLFLEAIKLSGCRAIIQTNWDKISRPRPVSQDIYTIDFINHQQIFPQCLGVVHHGGAGTTHSTLLAGTPSIVIAYAWDQFFWSRQLENLGCSSGNLKRKFLDELQLAGAIRKLMVDPEYKSKAEEFRRKIKREKGVTKGVNLLEEYMSAYFANNKSLSVSPILEAKSI